MTGWERFAKELSSSLLQHSQEIELANMFSGKSGFVIDRLRDFKSIGPNFDVAHFPTYPPGFINVAANTLVTIHDLTWWKYPEYSSFLGARYFRPLMERAVGLGAHISTVSQTSKLDICSFFGIEPSRVTAIYPGFNPSNWVGDVRRGVSELAKPYLLAVGSVEPRKNLARLVQAFSQSGLSIDMDLVIVGRRAWGNEIPGVVVKEGQTDAELAEWYRGCEALVFPSIYEGFGLPIIESLAFGKQIIVSDLPVFREIAGSFATYFDPLDAESISQALRHATSNPLTKSQTDEAREISNKFNWDRTATEYANLYRQLGNDQR
jgi:glycosyltransferase involved in cell wall biosynthesis